MARLHMFQQYKGVCTVSLVTDLDIAGAAISQWFDSHCNGQWEHHLGVTIETCDNPGWLTTFRGMNLQEDVLADIVGPLLRQFRAQVNTDGEIVRVFANSLLDCLLASGTIAELSNRRTADGSR